MWDKIYASLGASSETVPNFRILSKVVSGEEKKGRMRESFAQKMPNALAVLAQNQFEKLERLKEDTDLKKMRYRPGSCPEAECPEAEKLAKRVINLPTHVNVSEKQAQKIVDFLKTIL